MRYLCRPVASRHLNLLSVCFHLVEISLHFLLFYSCSFLDFTLFVHFFWSQYIYLAEEMTDCFYSTHLSLRSSPMSWCSSTLSHRCLLIRSVPYANIVFHLRIATISNLWNTVLLLSHTNWCLFYKANWLWNVLFLYLESGCLWVEISFQFSGLSFLLSFDFQNDWHGRN